MSSGPFLSHKKAFMNNLAIACAALSAEKRHKMSLTSNCVSANAMSSQGLAFFVQSVGHLAAATHLESKITGEWPWSNRPSVENILQSIKSPLPPVVTAIRQPHHDKWLFSGFYSSATRSFSFIMSSSYPVPQRLTLCLVSLSTQLF